MNDIDEMFSALADGTRRRVVELLCRGPQRASDIAHAMQMSPPAMSRHLRVLRTAGLVDVETAETDARERLYRLRPKHLASLRAWLDQVEAFWSVADVVPAARRAREAGHMTAPPASVRVSVTVAVAPDEAFRAFTEEIDQRYVKGADAPRAFVHRRGGFVHAAPRAAPAERGP